MISRRNADPKGFNCAACGAVDKACRLEDGKGPRWCPTKGEQEILDAALASYAEPETARFAREATIQEGECYVGRDARPYVMHAVKSRLEELIEFAARMGYRRLGLAYCGGLSHEAAALTEILEAHGFETVSVTCKVGGVPKERIGIRDDQKVRVGEFEAMCNPIAQARLLNAAATDFNILLGLCIGHDSLFLKHIEGLTTVFAVKDRVTGHNPLAPLYTSKSYYQRVAKRKPVTG